MGDFLQLSPAWLPLLDAAGKVTVLLGAATLLAALLRRASAAARHLVWTSALLAALALPLLSLALPRWQLPVVTLPLAAPLSHAAATVETERISPAVAAIPPSRRQAGPQTAVTGPTAPASRVALARVSWSTLLAVLWAAGALLVLGRLAAGVVAVRVMSRRTTPAADAAWLPLARQLAADLRVPRVEFRRTAHSGMPMTWGILRPVIVLPAAADAWPTERLRIALLHELAHVKRADCLTHMLAQAACACYWMNPLAWLAVRRARAERERACDDLVLACGTSGPDYADELLEIARAGRQGLFSTTAAGASLAMARRSQLEGRLMAILDPSVPRTGVSRVRTATVTALGLLTIVPLASLQPWTFAEAAMVPQLPMTQTPVQAPAVRPQTNTVPQAMSDPVPQSMPDALEEALVSQDPAPNPNPDPTPRSARSSASPKVVAALTEALKDTDKDVRESAMHALVQMRDPGIFEPLVLALKDTSADVRESAVHGLAQLRDKRAVAPLTGLLKDPSPGVREQAAFALGQLRDPSAVDPLAGALRDESAGVREQAAFALGQLRDQRAVEPLLPLLKDAAPNVREQAAFALGQLRARASVDALIGALADDSVKVREQAAFALGQIRDPKAIDALSKALKDASADVRQQAAFALGRLAR